MAIRFCLQKKNSENRQYCMDAMKKSMAEIRVASNNPNAPELPSFGARAHFPIPLPFDCNDCTPKNGPPMYYVDDDEEQNLHYRLDAGGNDYEIVHRDHLGECEACTVDQIVH